MYQSLLNYYNKYYYAHTRSVAQCQIVGAFIITCHNEKYVYDVILSPQCVVMCHEHKVDFRVNYAIYYL